eukprot:TRINITY_DN6217_c0_g1_i2.p2 TRINITY_DN6217_c0_g1~~TRINITY_DN6217_c0_g1_i2.p2  ORF type:complete len:185 (-),score=37.40 TRINITY_DN6217_c0_g1_i2:142-696(-)
MPPGRGVPVRITQGICAQHSRGGFMRAMAQFGEVIYCRKPPFSDIDSENYCDVGFATQTAADAAYAELKAGKLYVDGVLVGVGHAPLAGALTDGDRGGDRGKRGRDGSPSAPKANFKQRHDERSPSPRTMARMNMLGKRKPQDRRRSRSRSRDRRKKRRRSSSSSSSSSSRNKKKRSRSRSKKR